MYPKLLYAMLLVLCQGWETKNLISQLTQVSELM